MPSLRSQELTVTGMSGTACASRIKDALRHLPSVRTQIDVNTGKVLILFDGYSVTLNEVIKAIESAGFGIQSLPIASPHDLKTPARKRAIHYDLFDLILAVLLSLPLLLEKSAYLCRVSSLYLVWHSGRWQLPSYSGVAVISIGMLGTPCVEDDLISMCWSS